MPLASLHYWSMRGMRRGYLSPRSPAGVHLDMAAADFARLRCALRALCENVPQWAHDKQVPQESARIAVNEARATLADLQVAYLRHPEVKVRTSVLLRKHIQNTINLLSDAEIHVLHWDHPAARASLRKLPQDTLMGDRMQSFRFFDDL